MCMPKIYFCFNDKFDSFIFPVDCLMFATGYWYYQPRHEIHLQARSVVSFSSTHKYIGSRKLSKLSEKYCVLYFLFKIVVLIQAKNKASCPYFEQTWRKQNIILVALA